jgi:wobble nucleotide-excising tRNase
MSELQYSDQYVRHLERTSREKDEKIQALEQRIKELEAVISGPTFPQFS